MKNKQALFRNVFSVLLAMMATLVGQAQFYSHSLIYTKENVKFTVYLDGQRINPMPQSRVRAINLTQPYYKLKIVFEDPDIEPIEKRMFYTHDAYGYPVKLEHQIKRSKKGTWSLKCKAQDSWPGQAKPDSISYEMPPDELPGNIKTQNKKPCEGGVLEESTFVPALESIDKLSSDDSKLLVQKQFIKSNCVNVGQLKRLLQQISDEKKRLEIAQFAYEFTVDKGNYIQLNESFKDDKNIEALYKSISEKN